MSTKAALKAAKTALDSKDYDKAIEEAQSVLSSDSNNYFARLFLGRAYEKQSKFDDAAKAYTSAAKSKPDDQQGWLGLCSVYEAQGGQKLDEYRDVSVKAAEVFANLDDRDRCQTIINKLVDFTRKNGTHQQIKNSLRVQLPGSPIYDYLEGRLPHPSHTFTRLAELTESEEDQRIKREISERRTRIGARVGQVTVEVKRQVFAESELEDLYRELINWSSDDDVRRQYEEKLLERAYEHLTVLPKDEKAMKLDQVLTLAEGMVIIHHPFLLAWTLVLESRDLDELRDLDAGLLREFVAFFPENGTARIVKSWLSSELSPFPTPPPAEKAEGTKEEEPLTADDRLLLMTEGITDAEESPFAYRLVGDYFLHLDEHQTAVQTARTGIKALVTTSEKLGLGLQNTRDALNSVLATALVQYQAPRNHVEAKRLFEDILQRKPKFTPALIGLGLIFEETEDFTEAVNFLSQALEEDKGNVRVGTELAWCKAQGGDYRQAAAELEDLVQRIKADDPRDRDLRAQTLYRIGVCKWEADSDKSARRSRSGSYGYFLAAIKTNVNFAPAYTSLGFYYQDYAKDKKRARQCFQKAFELSPAETTAAERLARFFADQGDWDIVEVISKRVVDSGRAKPSPGSKKPGLSWPFSALGVVQMNKQEYQLAIVSFLQALRISPSDYQSYVGLGESYHNSGRYNSALRTFNYALEPHDGVAMKINGEIWFAKYMLANVHRELGDHDEAIARLQSVLEERPSEFGVLMSLLQTHVERASRSVETGLFGQAIRSANDALGTAKLLADEHSTAFNLWKAVGDASSVFLAVQSSISEFPSKDVIELFGASIDDDTYDVLESVDNVALKSLVSLAEQSESTSSILLPLTATILAYKRAIHCSADDIHAQAVAWYNLGWAEQRAYTCYKTQKATKKYLQAAVRCFKRAIELEAGNAEFWNALGVVTTLLNPKVAQHSFVRSLHLNELNAKVWANLGVLYLLQNDFELAHQAFGRSQSTDPDYAHAWTGEGIISLMTGNEAEALNHFTHAFEISDSASTVVKQKYTMSSFDHIVTASSAYHDLPQLIQPIFALEQLRTQRPGNLSSRHLTALLFERVGNDSSAVDILQELCAAAEAEYEASESLAALAQFAIAKSDLARNQLALRDFASAVENSEIALDLSSDEEESNSGLAAEARRKLRLSAHLTAGLALYNLGKMPDSIAMFRAALVESSNDPEVICSLVQVLWAQGGEEEKSVAREQLFDCVEKFPEHVGAVALLSAIAALDDDDDTLAAVKDDLISLRTKQNLSSADRDALGTLLAALAALAGGAREDDGVAVLSEAQTAIMLRPEHAQAWSDLAELSGETGAATMALHTAAGTVPPSGDISAAALAHTYGRIGTVGDAQRAAFIAPWHACGWDSINHCLTA